MLDADSPWRRVVLALLADAAFVAVWWLLVFYPGDVLVQAEAVGVATLDGATVKGALRLPPDGRHALVDAGDTIQLVTWAAIDGPDLSAARAAPGGLPGDLVTAASIPAADQVVAVVELPDGKRRSYTWRLGAEPDAGTPVEGKDPVWVDRDGRVRPAADLTLPAGAAIDGGVWPAGPNLVADLGDLGFAVLSRDGRVLAHQTDGQSLDPYPRGETTDVPYYTSASSYPRRLTCGPASCASSLGSVDWPYDSVNVATSPEGTRLAACAEKGLYLYDRGEDYGLFTGLTPMTCGQVEWVSEDLLFVQEVEGLTLRRLEAVGGRPLAGLWR